MHSIIYNYYNKENNLCVGISSKEYLKKLKKNQIIRVLYRETTEEQWHKIQETPREELYYMLNNTMNRSLFTFYIN